MCVCVCGGGGGGGRGRVDNARGEFVCVLVYVVLRAYQTVL